MKKYKKYNMLITLIKSIDNFVIFATTCSFLAKSVTGIVITIEIISFELSCGFIIIDKVVSEIVMQV